MNKTLSILFGLTYSFTAGAACEWKQLCNEYGQCRSKPVCERTYDLVPVQPLDLPKIAPPSIKPIQPPVLPPLGTSRCDQYQVQDNYGNWQWKTYCN